MTPAFPILVLLVAPGAPSASAVEVGYRHELLTRGADWREVDVEAAWQPADRTGLRLGARGLERFERRDLDLRASGSAPLGPRWTVAAEASASPRHRVVPAFTGGASLQRALGRRFVASGGVRWSRWDTEVATADAALGSLGLEVYWGPFRLGWTGMLGTLDGEWAAGNVLAWDHYRGDRDRIGVILAAGRELESTGGPAPLVSTVLAAAVRGQQGLGAAWVLTYEVSIQRQGDLFTRGGARLGIRRSF